MAEKAIIQESNAIALPPDITDQQGALVEPAAVGVHAVDRSGTKAGDSILITGAGTIGAMAALAARASGVTNIFVSEPNAARRERLQRMDIGVTVLDPLATDVASHVRSMTLEGIGADAAIECSGNGRAFSTCVDAVRAQGVVVQVGLMPGKIEADLFRWTVKDLTIRGSLNYPLTIWPRIFSMMRSGLFPVERVVDAEVAMQHVKEEGFDALLAPGSAMLKVLVSINS